MKKNKEYMYILYCVHIGILLPNIVWWLWARMGTLVRRFRRYDSE